MELTQTQLDALPCADPVQFYKGRKLLELCRDAALAFEPGLVVTLTSPSGVLTMRHAGNEYLRTGTKPTKVDEAERDRRATICKACEHYRHVSDKCGLCGCGAMIAQRATSVFGSCPDRKW